MIYLGSDHAGFKKKEKIKRLLDKLNQKYEDLGTDSEKSVDYPVYARKVGKAVVKNKVKGILICGTGTGMVIAANKIKGVRAVVAYDNYSAKMSRYDNDANVLCLRARQFSFEKTEQIIKTWLKTKFSNIPRHKRRIKEIE
tara:strand:- start:123 stop:545 length:423 start_codon:yes stop_codon:yes gene_type:complete